MRFFTEFEGIGWRIYYRKFLLKKQIYGKKTVFEFKKTADRIVDGLRKGRSFPGWFDKVFTDDEGNTEPVPYEKFDGIMDNPE